MCVQYGYVIIQKGPCGVVVSMLAYHAGDPRSLGFLDDGLTSVIVTSPNKSL